MIVVVDADDERAGAAADVAVLSHQPAGRVQVSASLGASHFLDPSTPSPSSPCSPRVFASWIASSWGLHL